MRESVMAETETAEFSAYSVDISGPLAKPILKVPGFIPGSLLPSPPTASKTERTPLTAARLRELLDYDPETGGFTWRVGGHGVHLGAVAGWVTEKGYVRIMVDGSAHYAHRLAWLWKTGEFPAAQIDHRDGDRANNKIANLREATAAENNQNYGRTKRNTSGLLGASWHRRDRRWRAQIRVAGRKLYLGSFGTVEEAHAAYLDAKSRLHSFQPAPRTSCEAPASDRREGL